LRLDPITVRDAGELFAVLDHPGLHTFTGGAPMSRDALEKWIEFVVPGHSPDGAETWRNWVVRLRDGGQTIGTVQATIVGDEATLAWTIGGEWQGHGYAKEAAVAVSAWVATSGVVWLRAAIHPEHAPPLPSRDPSVWHRPPRLSTAKWSGAGSPRPPDLARPPTLPPPRLAATMVPPTGKRARWPRRRPHARRR